MTFFAGLIIGAIGGIISLASRDDVTFDWVSSTGVLIISMMVLYGALRLMRMRAFEQRRRERSGRDS